MLLLGAVLVASGGCAARQPLDPLTADTGGPLSENERATDVLSYELTLEVLPEKETIRGEGVTVLRALAPLETVELQLDARLDVPEVRVDGTVATFERRGGILAVSLPQPAARGDEVRVAVRYGGKPHVAVGRPGGRAGVR